MRGLYTDDMLELMHQVAEDNPGAFSVLLEPAIEGVSRWRELLMWFIREGYTGSRLWVLYKDSFNCSAYSMVDWCKQQMWVQRGRDAKNPNLPKHTWYNTGELERDSKEEF